MLSKDDKIKLFELLNEYMQEIKIDQQSYGDCVTKEDLAYQVMISKHIQVIEEIKDVLSFDF